MSLLNQLSTYANGIGLSLNWSDCIKDFQLSNGEKSTFAQCKLECPLCHTPVSMRYAKMWKISNMTRHLRSHSTQTANSSSSIDSSSDLISTSQNSNGKVEVISVQVLHPTNQQSFDAESYQEIDYQDLIETDVEFYE